MRRFFVLLAALALLAALPVSAAARPGATSAGGVDPAIAYWTKERIAHAIPRDFTRTASGKFVPAARPPGAGGGGKAVTGASWTGGGEVLNQSGRVLFTLSGVDYICSASVVDDAGDASYSVVVTAGHCVYDEVADVFATNWIYMPRFDLDPDYDCQANGGCWVARALVIHHGFADQESFNGTTVLYDWGFAVVAGGGTAGQDLQLDATWGSYGLDAGVTSGPNPGYAFGYPAGGKYAPGLDLVYCKGAIGQDPYNANRNWKIGCDMTGGSSGGPWLYDTSNPGTTDGLVFSVNSYTYNGVKAMHGPKFNANTTASYNAAKNATPDNNGIDGIVVP